MLTLHIPLGGNFVSYTGMSLQTLAGNIRMALRSLPPQASWLRSRNANSLQYSNPKLQMYTVQWLYAAMVKESIVAPSL